MMVMDDQPINYKLSNMEPDNLFPSSKLPRHRLNAVLRVFSHASYLLHWFNSAQEYLSLEDYF